MKALAFTILMIGFTNFAQAVCPFNGELIDTNVAVQGYGSPSASQGHSCLDQMTQAICQASGKFNIDIYPHCQSKPTDCGSLSPGDPVYGFATDPGGHCTLSTVYCMPDGHLSGPTPEPSCHGGF